MMHIFTNSHDEAGLKWQNRHLMHCDTRQANFSAAIYGLNARCAFFGIVRICRRSAVHLIAFTKILPQECVSQIQAIRRLDNKHATHTDRHCVPSSESSFYKQCFDDRHEDTERWCKSSARAKNGSCGK